MMREKTIYRYMDVRLKNEREKELHRYLGNGIFSSEMYFYDLDIYQKNYSMIRSIKNELYKSLVDPRITLTKYQMEILSILNENGVFLSAPTSFGKTFIMLEYIKRNSQIRNIIFIIPTLALMNELLKKIYNLFGSDYNICINSEEATGEKNIFVFVPERSDQNFLNMIKSLEIDFLVFDEIYKLQGTEKDIRKDDRIIYMNKVYLNLITKAKKVALLGPYINNVEFENTKLDIVKYYTNFMPVYNSICSIADEENWVKHIQFDFELVYFKSPNSIYENINKILDCFPENQIFLEKYKQEITHLESVNGKDWYVIDLLKRGIGIHHGKTPMFLRKFYESEFGKGNIKVLLCTNTLMEGINTPTRSLIIVDNPGDPFKFNNLVGRVGRLNTDNPTIGKILICDKTITEYLDSVDNWLDLTILAEKRDVISSDEIIHLNKKHQSEKTQQEVEDKLAKLYEIYQITKDMISERNVEFDKVVEFDEKNYSEKFKAATRVYNCIVIATELITGPSYLFQVNKYENLDTDYSYLPYKVYINKIIHGTSFIDILEEFNSEFNKKRDKNNINIFIDGLYNLNNFIRFKLSKIVDYLELFKVDNNNKIVTSFKSALINFNQSKTAYKILDDLGIESADAEILINKFQLIEKVSASIVIKKIREKKGEVSKGEVSPFTLNNLDNI